MANVQYTISGSTRPSMEIGRTKIGILSVTIHVIYTRWNMWMHLFSASSVYVLYFIRQQWYCSCGDGIEILVISVSLFVLSQHHLRYAATYCRNLYVEPSHSAYGPIYCNICTSLRYKRIVVSDEFIVHCASKRTWVLCCVVCACTCQPISVSVIIDDVDHETAVMCVFPRKFIFTACWRLIDCYCICVEFSENREEREKTVKKTNELKTLSFQRFVFFYARHYFSSSLQFFLFILNCVLCTRILVHLMTERSHNVARASLCTQFIGSKVFMCVCECYFVSSGQRAWLRKHYQI